MHDILDPLAAVCVGLVVEGPGDEALLLGLDLDHLLLHGVRGDEPVDGDGPGLTQPVDAVEALPLGRGVPGGVQQQEVVGGCEVEADPPRPEAEQHHSGRPRAAALEGSDSVSPNTVRHCPGYQTLKSVVHF